MQKLFQNYEENDLLKELIDKRLRNTLLEAGIRNVSYQSGAFQNEYPHEHSET